MAKPLAETNYSFGMDDFFQVFLWSFRENFIIIVFPPARGHMTPILKACLFQETAVELKYFLQLQLGQSFNSILS